MSDDWKTIEAAFAAASELDGEARETFLADFERDHPQLIGQLRDLLAADADDRELAEPIASTMESLAGETKDSWLGREIGAWKLVRRIGEGGMGAVFLAQRADDEFEQAGALKLMTSRVIGRDAVARFRAERQFLAKLSHPNIAQLLDGGSTDEGQPYLVMEYIDGVSIDRYCDIETLDVPERLRLIGKVCDAVDYAHRNLIVHRDLKPGNILVDGRGEPKLLDFGIAKLLDAHAIDQTLAMTREGMLVLTPEYASPEQVRGEPPSIATDVYALGVLLYRLLTGHSPYGASPLTGVDLEKAIVSQDPARPSTVVTTPVEITGAVPFTAEDLSAQRSTSPERLRKRLVGDLDNIVLKALQKDPSRRYSSVARLRDDIDNYLASRPVNARPDSFAYRAGKFVRRNWLPVAAVSIFVVTVTALVTYYTARLAHERDTARLEAARAEQVAEFLTDLFEEASPAKNFGKPMDARQLLDTGAARIADELDDQPDLRAALTLTIADTYLKMRENKTAREFLEPLLDDIGEQVGRDDPAFLRLEREFGNALLYTGNPKEAKAIFERNHASWQRIAVPDSFEMGIAEQRLGTTAWQLNENEASEEHLLTAMRILRNHADPDPTHLTQTMTEYGVLLRNTNRFEEEEALLREAMALQEACCGTEQTGYVDPLNNLGNNYYARGMYAKAEETYREVTRLQKILYGEDGVGHANALMNLSNAVKENGNLEEALAMQTQGREIYGRGYGDDSVQFAYASENIGNFLMEMRRFDEAEKEFLAAMNILEQKFGADDVEYAITQSNYGNMLMRAGRNDEGMPQLIASHETFLAQFGPQNPSVIHSNIKIANGLLNMEQPERALEHALAAVEAAKGLWSGPHPSTVEALTTLGRTYRDSKEFDQSFAAHREAIEMAGQLDGERLRPVILAEYDLGVAMKAAGQLDEARALLEPRREEIAEFDETWEEIRDNIDTLLGG